MRLRSILHSTVTIVAPCFTTTQTMVDNKPTLWKSYTDNLAKTGLTVWV